MKKINEVLTDTIGKLANTDIMFKPEEEEPVIVIDKEYVEILGHRIDVGFESFESFIEYFYKLREFDKEREEMDAELRNWKCKYIEMRKYLDKKIAESMFLRDHIDGVEHLSIQEKIYREVRDMIHEIDKEEE